MSQENTRAKNALMRRYRALTLDEAEAFRAFVQSKDIRGDVLSHDIQRGSNRVRPQRLKVYAEGLGCTMEDLLDEPTARKPRPATRGATAALTSLSTPNA